MVRRLKRYWIERSCAVARTILYLKLWYRRLFSPSISNVKETPFLGSTWHFRWERQANFDKKSFEWGTLVNGTIDSNSPFAIRKGEIIVRYNVKKKIEVLFPSPQKVYHVVCFIPPYPQRLIWYPGISSFNILHSKWTLIIALPARYC